MRNFLISVMPAAMWALTALNLLFMAALFVRWKKTKQALCLWMALVAFGLFYDALILSLGTFLPAGGTLKALSLPRFILHCGLIPLLFPICGKALGLKASGMKIVWAVTAVIMAAGIAAGAATVLEPQAVGEVTRYASAKDQTPAWSAGIQNGLSYGPIVILILCGLIAWIKNKRPWLFFSGLAMFIFSALAPATGNMDLMFFISMFGEVLMVLFMYLYAKTEKK